MVAVGKRDEKGSGSTFVFEVVEGHLERHLHRAAPVVGVKTSIHTRKPHEPLRKTDNLLVCEAGEYHMLESFELLVYLFIDVVVAVAKKIDPPATDTIDVGVVFEVVEIDPFGSLDRNDRDRFVIFHLGTRVPDMCQVSTHKLFVSHRSPLLYWELITFSLQYVLKLYKGSLMISWMQKHKKYLVITIWISTIAFVGAGFVGWGAYKFGSGGDVVAEVGEVKIGYKDLQQKYSQLYNTYNRLFKGNFDQQKAKEFGLEKQALGALVKEALLENFAKDHDIMVSDEEVAQKIASMDIFRQNGTFSKKLYLQLLRNNGLKPKDFEQSVKKELLIQKVSKLLAPKLFDTEFDTIASALFIGDKIEYKPIDTSDIVVEANEEALKKYFQNHKENYFTPTIYHLALIEVPFLDEKVSEKQMKAYYEGHRIKYKDKDGKILPFEQAKALVEKDIKRKMAKRDALKTYIAFKKGKVSAQKQIAISHLDSLPKKIVEQIKNASVGTTFKPVEQESGYVIYKLIKIEPPRAMNFQEAKNRVETDYIKEQRAKLLLQKARKMLPDFHGIQTDYITRVDVDKLKALDKAEAALFLKSLFTSKEAKGFIKISYDKVVLYKILDQKLMMQEKIDENRDLVQANALRLKRDLQNDNLVNRLQKLYSIKIYKGL